MLKRLFSIMFIISFMISCSCAGIESFSTNNCSFRMTDKGAVLDQVYIRHDNAETQALQIILPDKYEGIPLVGIESNSIPYCCESDVVIPEGVIYLEEYAFETCGNPDVVFLPSTLEIIPEGCFRNINSDIVFPNGNPFFEFDNGFLIDNRTNTLLYSSRSSAGQQLPSVLRIGDWSLYHWLCSKDQSEQNNIILPETLLSLGSYVFYDLPDLVCLNLPDGIESISSNCFFCTGLEEIEMPSSLTEIPAYCFTDCSLTSLTIPDGVSYICEYAVYRNWEELKEVTIPPSVQFVGYSAFPEETKVTALGQATHFETAEEYQARIVSNGSPVK